MKLLAQSGETLLAPVQDMFSVYKVKNDSFTAKEVLKVRLSAIIPTFKAAKMVLLD